MSSAQIDGRYFPISDHHIRGFSMIGEAERCLDLFRQIYTRNPEEFQIGSISNLIVHGPWLWKSFCCFVASLANILRGFRSRQLLIFLFTCSLPQRLEVRERPLMVVVSSDLRVTTLLGVFGCQLRVSYAPSFV